MSEAPTRPRRHRLQFSLASIFVLTTLSAIATWYWYQWPYAVENKTWASDDPFADSSVPPSPPAWTRREVEYVRRVYGGKTIRHGSRRLYDAVDNLLCLENYRNGQKHGAFMEYDGAGAVISEQHYINGVSHGRYFRRHPNGKTAVEGAYAQGVPVGNWSWFPRYLDPSNRTVHFAAIDGAFREGAIDGHWECRDEEGRLYLTADFDRGKLLQTNVDPFEPHLKDLLARGAIQNPHALVPLFLPVSLECVRMPLEDVARYLHDSTGASIHAEPRRTVTQFEPAPNQPTVVALPKLQVTCAVERLPLIVALKTILEPHGLACDFRYGVLWIDEPDSIANWQDTTGVKQLVPPRGSRLAEEWNSATSLHVVKMPLKDVMLYLQEVHGTPMAISMRPSPGSSTVLAPDSTVTANLRGLTFQGSLAIILDQLNCKATLNDEVIVIEPQ